MTAIQAANPEITDPNLDMYRQIHPSWVQHSRVTSMAFKPTKKDDKKLSVANSGKTTAEAAFKHHTETLKRPSLGSWGLSVKFINESELKCFEDPVTTDPKDPAHSFLDFQGLTNTQVEQRAAKLANHARDRGPLFAPPPQDAQPNPPAA